MWPRQMNKQAQRPYSRMGGQVTGAQASGQECQRCTGARAVFPRKGILFVSFNNLLLLLLSLLFTICLVEFSL